MNLYLYKKISLFLGILIFVTIIIFSVKNEIHIENEPCQVSTQIPTHQHPLTHEHQYYIVPSDSENGDNIGKVYELWTERRFKDRNGQQYTFEIVGGNTHDAFSIDRSTGELFVNNSERIADTTALCVMVKIGSDYQPSKIHIAKVDSKDIIYIDSQFSGTGKGTRSAPFKSFKESGLGNGTGGKCYLYRRGRIYNSDYINLFNPQDAPKITIGSWGKGRRPVLDGNNLASKFLNLGSVFLSVDEKLAAYNVDIMDLHFTNYRDNTLRMTRWGKNINFRRLYFENSESANGLIYLMANVNTSQLYPSNIYIGDIELDSYADRGIKIERGGVVVENVMARTTRLNPKAPISPTMMPDVMMRYIDAESNGGTGPNLRQYGQHIEWSYFKGFDRAIFLSATANADGSYGPWLLDDNHIRDVIIDGTTTSHGIFFESRPGAINTAENTEITRVIIKNAGKSGIAVSNKVKNVKITYSLIYDSREVGIRIDAGSLGTKIHNCIIVDNGQDIVANDKTELKNSIYSRISGSFSEQNNSSETQFFVNRNQRNYRPKSGAPYLNKGLDLGYHWDLDGNKPSNIPTIGAFEK